MAKVVKYMVENDKDAAMFVLVIGKAKFYDNKSKAQEVKASWQKVIKVTVEEL